MKSRRKRASRQAPRLEHLEERNLLSINLLTDFDGLGFANNSVGLVPPDTNAAATPNAVVEVDNSAITVQDPGGLGPLIPNQTLNAFFPAAGTLVFDPQIKYDELAHNNNGALVISAEDVNNSTKNSFLDVAIENNNDPTTNSWTKIRFNDTVNIGGQLYWLDNPHLGYNADDYVISGNMFSFTTGAFGGDAVWVIHKRNLGINGWLFSPGSGFSIQPASQHDALPGDSMWFVTQNLGNFGNSLEVLRWTNIETSPTITPYIIPVNAYSSPVAAPQQGTSDTINTDDSRINQVAWRDDRLLAAQTVSVGGTDEARWYVISTNAQPSGGVALLQTWFAGGNGVYTYYPGGDIGATGDLGLTYMESSTSEFMSMYVAVVRSTPYGTSSAVADIAPGGNPYLAFDGSPHRAGDYSSVAVDPSDSTGTTFWAANEYADPNNTFNNWLTHLSQFQYTGTIPAAPSGSGGLGSLPPPGGLYSGTGALSISATAISAGLATIEGGITSPSSSPLVLAPSASDGVVVPFNPMPPPSSAVHVPGIVPPDPASAASRSVKTANTGTIDATLAAAIGPQSNTVNSVWNQIEMQSTSAMIAGPLQGSGASAAKLHSGDDVQYMAGIDPTDPQAVINRIFSEGYSPDANLL